MNLSIVRYYIGWIVFGEGALLLIPMAVSLGYHEAAATALGLSALVCLVLGGVTVLFRPSSRTLRQREGMAITALGWIAISLLGSLPFLFSGEIVNPVDALFETVSGFTTTGASILNDVEAMSRGLLFWRSFTHWVGGMGVLVFLLTILPRPSGSLVNLMKAESPGPQVEKLVPKVQSTAKILYGIYFGMTALEIVLLLAGGMPAFDAVTLSFGTAGTGGFGIRNDSIASYAPYLQNVITVFMVLFGINFNFYFFLLLGKWKRSLQMEEVHWYLAIIGIAAVIILIDTRSFFGSFGESARHVFFQIGSVITTTGYATTDFNLWPQLSKMVMVLLMFIGACAGSTGGGFKVSRVILLHKYYKKERRRMLHPTSVGTVCVDGKAIPHEIVHTTCVFLAAYVLLFFTSLLLVSFDENDFTTNFTAVLATLNNIGPGLAGVGPTRNFADFSWPVKLVLIFDMLAGRLELFPMLVLFNRETWRRF